MKRPRFSLRVALLSFTLIGVGLGFYGRHLAEHRRQMRLLHQAQEACKTSGCRFLIDTLARRTDRYVMDLQGPQVSPSVAQAIVDAEYVERVRISEPLDQQTADELAKAFHPLKHDRVWVRTGSDRNDSQ